MENHNIAIPVEKDIQLGAEPFLWRLRRLRCCFRDFIIVQTAVGIIFTGKRLFHRLLDPKLKGPVLSET